jgi:hypothetical protein
MAILATMNIPTPKSWDEFEDISLAIAKIRWRCSDFYRNGRQGQSQQGVDIWGHDSEGSHVGVQCKNTVSEITEVTVVSEISKAEDFKPSLDKLYIATTAKRDTTLQEAIRKISNDRKNQGKFEVNILFWDDIIQDLSSQEDEFFKFYPQIKSKVMSANEHDVILLKNFTNLMANSIEYFDEQNMAFSFNSLKLDPLLDFLWCWNKPEKEFLNTEIEQAKMQFWHKLNEYNGYLATNTFPTKLPNRLEVPKEWEEGNPQKFDEVVSKLHQMIGEVIGLYNEVIRTAKKQLHT